MSNDKLENKLLHPLTKEEIEKDIRDSMSFRAQRDYELIQEGLLNFGYRSQTGTWGPTGPTGPSFTVFSSPLSSTSTTKATTSMTTTTNTTNVTPTVPTPY